MNAVNTRAVSKTIHMTFDGMQHCTAVKVPQGKYVSMDCPYTGRGEELSPMNLLCASLAGSVALSMGAAAMQHEMDLRGLTAEVTAKVTDPPKIRLLGIDVKIKLPRNFCDSDRTRLERAANTCPIKHAFAPSVQVVVTYHYP